MSDLEERLAFQMMALKLPVPEREYRFAAHHVGMGKGIKTRLKDAGLADWRFDFAWPELMLAVEVEGGTYTNGRHTRGKAFAEDCRKYGEALIMGWRVYRCTTCMIRSGQSVQVIKKLINLSQVGK